MSTKTALLSESSILARIFDHIDNKTTDLGDTVWKEPVANYLSDERFNAEIALLRSLPVVYCLSAMLPDNGSYVARRAAGSPKIAAVLVLLYALTMLGPTALMANLGIYRVRPDSLAWNCKKTVLLRLVP